jgi:Heavy metal binding domain
MRNIVFVCLALALSLSTFSACKNSHSKNVAQTAEAAAPGTKFICPMNCEKDKTYDKPGACPVCHMDLEAVKAEVEANKAEYFTAFAAVPAQLEAGKPGVLSFTPKIKGNENAPVALELVHEKKMHLILVSEDLSWFDHIHPEYSASGAYEIKVLGKGENFAKGRSHNETRFGAGGKYLAFTDFQPVGGLNQVNKTEIEVAGAPAKAVSYTQPKLNASVDGYTVVFDAHGPAVASGTPAHLHIDISDKSGKLTPDKIENYLGAKAHVVMIETTTKEFVHIHPEAAGDELEMNTTFQKPGLYRGWLQFQTNGRVHTADFVMKVEAGKAGATGAEGHNGH